MSFQIDDLNTDLNFCEKKYDQFGLTNSKKRPDLYDTTSEKVVGKFNIETSNSFVIIEFTPFRVKAFALTCDNGEEGKKT